MCFFFFFFLSSSATPIKQSIKKHGIKALKDTELKLLSGSGKIKKKEEKEKEI